VITHDSHIKTDLVIIIIKSSRAFKSVTMVIRLRPFPRFPQSHFQSESKCDVFVVVISSNFNMNES